MSLLSSNKFKSRKENELNIRDIINSRHMEVSNLKTPAEYIDKIEALNLEYPAVEYMRSVADHYYPGWQWKIINANIINIGTRPVEFVVQGELYWPEFDLTYENILFSRIGAMVAAHTVQYTIDKKTNAEKILDLGNDVKAANTDTLKKALNIYLNICDDVYRWEDPRLTNKMKEDLELEIEKIPDVAAKLKMANSLKNPFTINKRNFKESMRRVLMAQQPQTEGVKQ